MSLLSKLNLSKREYFLLVLLLISLIGFLLLTYFYQVDINTYIAAYDRCYSECNVFGQSDILLTNLSLQP